MDTSFCFLEKNGKRHRKIAKKQTEISKMRKGNSVRLEKICDFYKKMDENIPK